MSGIFGVLESKRNTSVPKLLDRMGSQMSHREWYVVENHSEAEAGVGLGRIGIGIFNQEEQPRCNEDQSLTVFLAGEFYKTEETRRDLKKKGHHFRDDSDLELALRLYEEKGDHFIHDLEGAFVLAVWNRPRQQLLIANDRFGLYPLYYAHYDGKLVFAPEMKGILCDPGFHKELDMTALAEYMRFQQLLGDKTFFEELRLLGNASLLHYDVRTDHLAIQQYWNFSEVPCSNINFEQAVDGAGRLLERALSRLVSGPHRVGIYLSGGKDSRILIGLAARERTRIHSVTFGAPDSRDAVYAQRVAKRAGSEHHFFEYTDGRWVQANVDFHLELTEGFHNWVHLHGIDTLKPMREHIDMQLTGFCGDHLLHSRFIDQVGYSVVQTWDNLAFAAKMFYMLCQKFSWPGLDEGEAECVYTESIRREMRGRAFASLKQELVPFEKYDPLKRLDYFKFANHAMRLTHNYVTFYRSTMEVRYPFLDYDFFDFVCNLPPKIRFGGHGQLYRELLNREVPELTLIPSDKNERLLTNDRLLRGVHAVASRFKRSFNRYIAEVFPRTTSLYADYENYLRTDLRKWGESILFDRRTLDRGIFNPQFFRSIWARHQSGKELHTIGKIAPIMTYEMMLRRFYD